MTEVIPALIILPRETGDAAGLVQIIVDATNDYTTHGQVGKYVPYLAPLYRVRTTAVLNMRDGPSVTGTAIVRLAKQGDVLSVYREFATSAGWAWLKVSPDREEWVSGKYTVKTA